MEDEDARAADSWILYFILREEGWMFGACGLDVVKSA